MQGCSVVVEGPTLGHLTVSVVARRVHFHDSLHGLVLVLALLLAHVLALGDVDGIVLPVKRVTHDDHVSHVVIVVEPVEPGVDVTP